ncbi:hypothetical protein GCM10023080_002850 [Streptomyces pseudoechinosporeus]
MGSWVFGFVFGYGFVVAGRSHATEPQIETAPHPLQDTIVHTDAAQLGTL